MIAPLSRAQRRFATRFVHRSGILNHPELDDDAKALYLIGAAIANPGGHVAEDDVIALFSDAPTRAWALSIVKAQR